MDKAKKPRIICFDIEATNLSANMGRMLAFGYRVVGEHKTHVLSIADYRSYNKDKTNDSELAKAAGEILASADVVVAHFGKYYDIPYINTRLIANGLPVMPKLNLVDTWEIAKKRLKLTRNTLAVLTQLFGLKDKTHLDWDIWIKAACGDKKALGYIVEHCRVDVEVLESAYLKMRQLWPEHPGFTAKPTLQCPVCFSLKTQKRGYAITAASRKHRVNCQDCGHWFTRPVQKGD